MDIISFVVGIFIIAVGFLVKSAPNLIAGYNTMPSHRKKNVDIEGLSTLMRNGLVAIGATIIVGYFLFKWIGFTMIANSMILVVTLVGVTILVVKAKRYDHNEPKKTKLTYIVLGLTFAFVIGLITYGYIPSKTRLNNQSVQFSGMYGFDINISDIETITLTDTIPVVGARTNGFSFGSVSKGFFLLEGYGKCRLLIHSHKPPFIVIFNGSGEKSIVNFKDRTQTETTYRSIKQLMNRQL